MPMIAITTSSSTNVNAFRFVDMRLLPLIRQTFLSDTITTLIQSR